MSVWCIIRFVWLIQEESWNSLAKGLNWLTLTLLQSEQCGWWLEKDRRNWYDISMYGVTMFLKMRPGNGSATRLLHLAVDKFNLDCKIVDEDAIERELSEWVLRSWIHGLQIFPLAAHEIMTVFFFHANDKPAIGDMRKEITSSSKSWFQGTVFLGA